MGQTAINDERQGQPPHHTDLPVGEVLRRARLHYNQSTQDVERNLRIRASQIEAIENGEFHKIPGRAYVIGFLRSYAEYLGLDGEKMVSLYKAQSGQRTAKPELNFPVAASEIKIPPLWLIGGCLAAAVLIMAGWWMTQSGHGGAPEQIPTIAEAMPEEQKEAFGPVLPDGVTLSPAPQMTASEAAAIAPAAGTEELPKEEAPKQALTEKGIILNIKENSWVEIKDEDENSLVAKVLKKGDRYFVPDRPDLTISLGNAAGVQVEIDGLAMNPLGKNGEVLRDLPLDAASLKKNYSPER